MKRKASVVLFTSKALFLCGTHDIPINDQRGSIIVVERRYSKNT
jgi:hypothetical protein